MKWRAVAGLLALAGCSRAMYFDPPASVYRHYGDRLRVYLNPFFGQPCGREWGPAKSNRMPNGKCYVFGPPRRMSGVLRLEGYSPANFYPGLTRAPIGSQEWDRDWRAVADRYRLIEPWPNDRQPFSPLVPRMFRVTFTGRMTERFAPNTHRRIVIIDRIESIARVRNGRP